MGTEPSHPTIVTHTAIEESLTIKHWDSMADQPGVCAVSSVASAAEIRDVANTSNVSDKVGARLIQV